MTTQRTSEVVVIDSITEVRAEHAGRIVVTGSHGGASAGHYALMVRAKLYVFNDAGIGKDEAGIAALGLLNGAGIAAIAVAHTSARIGDADDTLRNGIVSRVNATAKALGLATGHSLREVVPTLDERA